MQRHTEAKLARDLGVEPTVDLRGFIRVRNGRVVGLMVGPADGVEILRSPEFRAWDFHGEAVDLTDDLNGKFIGYLHGIAIYMLDEDLP